MQRNYCPYCMSPTRPGAPCPSCGLTEGTYTPLPHHLPHGTVLAGRYLVGRVLGEGGFGITYIGCDLRLELKVAIKEFFPGDKVTRNHTVSPAVVSYTGAVGQDYEASRDRFLKEARAMARMDKTPQIVAVRDFFEENNTAYIVMEYVDGTTFKELVAQKGGRIASKELLSLVEPLFGALGAMHKLGLIHRDISPDNLMLENGCVRLLDFGCAREADKGNATMTIVLKRGYSPIEQYQHKGQGPWTDVYSLAATLYFCLTGTSPPQVLDRICDEELVPPRQLGADLTPVQEKAILRGMGVRRSQRYSSVEEFHAALFEGAAAEDNGPPEKDRETGEGAPPDIPAAETPADGDAPDSTPDRLVPRGRRLWSVVGGVATVVLCMVLLVWRPWDRELPEPSPGPAGSPSQSTAAPSETPKETSPAPMGNFNDSVPADVNGEVFLRQLADDRCTQITVPENVWVEMGEDVTLTKPLTIAASGGASFHGGLTVAEGGSVTVRGSLDAAVLLRTVDGGTVSVEDGGFLGSPMVWLSREDDLTCAENGTVDVWGGADPTKGPIDGYARSHYWVFDEEKLFAGAIHVTTEEEFAWSCQGSVPLVIDRDLALTRQYWPTVSVLVPEGVTLDAPCPDTARDAGNCTIEMRHGTILVNHGTVTGRVSFDGIRRGENGQWLGEDPCMLVNFGTMDVSLLSEMCSVLNLGDMATREILRNTALHNLGSLTFDEQMEGKGNWWQLSGTVAVTRNAELVLYGSTGVNSYGQTVIEGRLRNEGQLCLRTDCLTVKAGGGLFNHGYLRVDQAARLQAESGTELQNSGVIVDSGRQDLQGYPFQGPGRLLRVDYDSERTRSVNSESELLAVLADDRYDVVVWDGYDPARKIDLNGGPIELTKGLVLRGSTDTPVDFNTGGLTLSGENAFFISDNVDFHGYELHMEGGTALLDGGTGILGDISVDGGRLLLVGGAKMPDPGRLDLRNGGAFVMAGSIEFGQCAVTVDRDSALCVYGSLGLINCNVANKGQIASNFGYLYQEGGSLTNHGELYLVGWDEMMNLGDVSNHGQITIAGRQLVSGTLVNEADGVMTLVWEDCPLHVSGHLVNGGSIWAARGTYIDTGDGGSFSGSSVTYG